MTPTKVEDLRKASDQEARAWVAASKAESVEEALSILDAAGVTDYNATWLVGNSCQACSLETLLLESYDLATTLKLLKVLVSRGMNLNVLFYNGNTLLWWIATSELIDDLVGVLPVVKELATFVYDRGIRFNTEDDHYFQQYFDSAFHLFFWQFKDPAAKAFCVIWEALTSKKFPVKELALARSQWKGEWIESPMDMTCWGHTLSLVPLIRRRGLIAGGLINELRHWIPNFEFGFPMATGWKISWERLALTDRQGE